MPGDVTRWTDSAARRVAEAVRTTEAAPWVKGGQTINRGRNGSVTPVHTRLGRIDSESSGGQYSVTFMRAASASSLEAVPSIDAVTAYEVNGTEALIADGTVVVVLIGVLDQDGAVVWLFKGPGITPKRSIEFDTDDEIDGQLQLVGDEESPGVDKVYGTDDSGVRGWKDDPAGADEKVKASSGDSTAGYLDGKVANSIVVSSDALQLSGDSASPGAKKGYRTDDAGDREWGSTEVTVKTADRYNEGTSEFQAKYQTLYVIGADDEGDWTTWASDGGGDIGGVTDSMAANLEAASSESLGYSSSLISSTSSWAISAWVRPTTIAGYIASGYNTSAGRWQWNLDLESGTRFSTDNGGTVYHATTGMTANVWTHLLGIFEGSTLYLYKNGTLAASTGISGTPVSADNSRVGCRNQGAGDQNFMDGRIDHLGLWSGLSLGGTSARASFATSLYNGGCGKAYTELSTADKTNLVHYYDLEEASGSRVDAHGSADLTENGTIGNAAGPC